MRQLIIARKDLGMSSGKLAAQCCHASEAFLTSHLRDRANVTEVSDVTATKRNIFSQKKCMKTGFAGFLPRQSAQPRIGHIC